MLAVERAGYIMNALADKKIVLVTELSKDLGVSEETVRKDLEKLEKQGRLRRVHGGAYLDEGYSNETPVVVRAKIYQGVKEMLAQKCMDFIEEKETIFLDCSTTVSYLAKKLVHYDKKLTVVTNSLLVATQLAINHNIRLILLGGEFNRDSGAFDGYTVFEALERYHIDKAFFSSAGIDKKAGMTDYTQGQADLRRKVLQEAGKCIFVSDSTKLGRKATYVVGGPEKIDYLIIDHPIGEENQELYDRLVDAQVKVVVCKEREENG